MSEKNGSPNKKDLKKSINRIFKFFKDMKKEELAELKDEFLNEFKKTIRPGQCFTPIIKNAMQIWEMGQNTKAKAVEEMIKNKLKDEDAFIACPPGGETFFVKSDSIMQLVPNSINLFLLIGHAGLRQR